MGLTFIGCIQKYQPLLLWILWIDDERAHPRKLKQRPDCNKSALSLTPPYLSANLNIGAVSTHDLIILLSLTSLDRLAGIRAARVVRLTLNLSFSSGKGIEGWAGGREESERRVERDMMVGERLSF